MDSRTCGVAQFSGRSRPPLAHGQHPYDRGRGGVGGGARGGSNICYDCGQPGHRARACSRPMYEGCKNGDPARNPGGRTIKTCSSCGELGHFQSECPSAEGSRPESRSAKAASTKFSEEDHHAHLQGGHLLKKRSSLGVEPPIVVILDDDDDDVPKDSGRTNCTTNYSGRLSSSDSDYSNEENENEASESEGGSSTDDDVEILDPKQSQGSEADPSRAVGKGAVDTHNKVPKNEAVVSEDSDVEADEAIQEEVRQKWEEAALRKRVAQRKKQGSPVDSSTINGRNQSRESPPVKDAQASTNENDGVWSSPHEGSRFSGKGTGLKTSTSQSSRHTDGGQAAGLNVNVADAEDFSKLGLRDSSPATVRKNGKGVETPILPRFCVFGSSDTGGQPMESSVFGVKGKGVVSGIPETPDRVHANYSTALRRDQYDETDTASDRVSSFATACMSGFPAAGHSTQSQPGEDGAHPQASSDVEMSTVAAVGSEGGRTTDQVPTEGAKPHSLSERVGTPDDRLIGERERMKESVEFQQADQEEWIQRQQELQRQALEVQRLRKRKRAEGERKAEMESRQRQRLEEMREKQQQEEWNMGRKEQVRGQIRAHLEHVCKSCYDMASLLQRLGIPIDGAGNPTGPQVQAAYKKALLTFHPDRASVYAKGDPRKQVEAEESFKIISRQKKTLPWVSGYHHNFFGGTGL